ncbi:virion structural protein [Thermoproteus tenax virus 1]|uniref:Coat protein TP3 n=1 Tax=Thermoproteus tenax virus 1 (strain KRA1) TaxID=10480 RepID=COA3_TTV1K|nr:virion structural protein [Thermoproteus tenax virus 1]P19272.3 RecName: Full=Coat protein TP3 [Thermoproteus tenax virus 1 (STRAIN KRA1)]CAA32989.1 unnamed protein product [Thermoproteus tenax virus 1]
MVEIKLVNKEIIKFGLALGIVNELNEYLYAAMPPMYDILSKLYGYGRTVNAMLYSVLFNLLESRIDTLRRLDLSKFFAVVAYMDAVKDTVELAINGYAYVTTSGFTVYPASQITGTYESDFSQAKAVPANTTATQVWFAPKKFALITQNKIYTFLAPYWF